MNSWLDQINALSAQYMQMQAQQAGQQYQQNPQLTNETMGQLLSNNGGIVGAGGEMMQEWNNVFLPEIRGLVNDANSYAGTARIQLNMGEAESQVGQAFDQNRQSALADLQSFGIDPSSGRYAALDAAERTAQAASQAGAGNIAEQQTEAVARALRSEAIQATANLPGYAAGLQNANTNQMNAQNNYALGQGQLSIEQQKLALQRQQLAQQRQQQGNYTSPSPASKGGGGGSRQPGGGGSNPAGSNSGGGGGGGGPNSTGNQPHPDNISEGGGGGGGKGGGGGQPGAQIMGGGTDLGGIGSQDLPSWDGSQNQSQDQGALSPLDPSFDPTGGGQDPWNSGAAGSANPPWSGDSSNEFGSDMPDNQNVSQDQVNNTWDSVPTDSSSWTAQPGDTLSGEIQDTQNEMGASRGLGSSTGDDNSYDQGADQGYGGGADSGGGSNDSGDDGSYDDGSGGGEYGGGYDQDYGGSYDSGGDDESYASGGDVHGAAQAVHQRAGAIPSSMSGSGGKQVDDVPARLNGTNEQIRLNTGEFIVPEDAVRWKGEEYFQKLIQQSRKARQAATARPTMKPALPQQGASNGRR